MADADDPNFAEVFSADLFDDIDAGKQTPAPTVIDPSALFADGGESTVGSHIDSDDYHERFDDDTSELPHEVCWTLQELVAAPHVTEKSRKHWPVVLQYENVLRSRLSELGLVLEINREYRYAFTRQADDPSPHSRTILRAKTLSLAASALALYLYNQYIIAPDDPIVERADMIDHMMAYKPADDTDEAAFQRKINTAIKALDDASIIKPMKGNDDRFTIYGVITSILTAEQVTALDARYKAIARGDTVVRDNDVTDDTDEQEYRDD